MEIFYLTIEAINPFLTFLFYSDLVQLIGAYYCEWMTYFDPEYPNTLTFELDFYSLTPRQITFTIISLNSQYTFCGYGYHVPGSVLPFIRKDDCYMIKESTSLSWEPQRRKRFLCTFKCYVQNTTEIREITETGETGEPCETNNTYGVPLQLCILTQKL